MLTMFTVVVALCVIAFCLSLFGFSSAKSIWNDFNIKAKDQDFALGVMLVALSNILIVVAILILGYLASPFN